MHGSREVLVSTVFAPVTEGPVLSAYMNNLQGLTAIAVPTRIAAGHYQVQTFAAFDQKRISITARGYNAAGDVRHVSAVLGDGNTPGLNPTTADPVNTPTVIDIYIRDDANAVSDDALFVEVTVAQLPQGFAVP